jgi:hypothetical protein
VAASGFTFISWWQLCCVRGRGSRPDHEHSMALKGVLKFRLKQLQHVSVCWPSSGSALYELAKVTMLKQSIKIHWYILQKKLCVKLVTYQNCTKKNIKFSSWLCHHAHIATIPSTFCPSYLNSCLFLVYFYGSL